jgi:hypothetical protein
MRFSIARKSSPDALVAERTKPGLDHAPPSIPTFVDPLVPGIETDDSLTLKGKKSLIVLCMHYGSVTCRDQFNVAHRFASS